MRILVPGSTGMLGQALVSEARSRGADVTGLAMSGADIDVDMCDPAALGVALRSTGFDAVVNTAAITSLGACEDDPCSAYLVNARAVALIASACRETGTYLLQISTDHYWSGDGKAAHDESAPVTLVNEYVRTKYAGEAFAAGTPGALVVRTNIVGFRGWEGRPTFVEWVLGSLEAAAPMTLIEDMHTSSIDVRTVAAALLELCESRPTGLLNLASSEVSSKREFIEALAAAVGLAIPPGSRAGSRTELRDAARADSMGLDVTRAEELLGSKLPGLAEVVGHLAEEYRGLKG